MIDQNGWAAITIEFLNSTDTKTVGHILEKLNGLNVRVRVQNQPVRDMRVTSVLARRGCEGGFLFSPIGADGEPISASQRFVSYEDVEAIGVY